MILGHASNALDTLVIRFGGLRPPQAAGKLDTLMEGVTGFALHKILCPTTGSGNKRSVAKSQS